MMRRLVFLCIGLGILLAPWGLCRDGQASSTYQVRQGDTLSGIAERLGVAPDDLRAANHLTKSNLNPLQILIIPAPSAPQTKSQPSSSLRQRIYLVKKGDSLEKIARKTGVSVASLREINRLKGSALKIGQKIELYRSQVSEAAETPELVNHQVKPEPEPEAEEDGGTTNDGVSTVAERPKQENAAPFGQWKNPEEQKMLVKVAMGFLGAPYRLGGSSVTGLDCSAFVKKTYQFFNIDLPRTAFQQSLVGLRVKRSELVAGDLIFFDKRRRLSHVGIYIGDNKFVHASSYKRRVRVDNLNMPYFDKHFIRAVRLKGNDEGSVTSHRQAHGG